MSDDALAESLSIQAVLNANWDSESTKYLRDIIEFDGPPTSCCFGVQYTTLTQWGEKIEGFSYYPANAEPHWSREQAIYHFRKAFWSWLIANALEKSQLAWRTRPRAEQRNDGSWLVYARLAVG